MAKGFHEDGTGIMVPQSNQITNFMYSGDPVLGEGYLDSHGGERYSWMSSGPFSFKHGESQEIIGVKIVAGGESSLNSVALLKKLAVQADSLFQHELFNLKRYAKNPFPKSFELSEAYPNPFKNRVTLAFKLSRLEHVTIKVYNILGQTVATMADEPRQPGIYSSHWEGRDALGKRLSAGVYLIHFKAGQLDEIRKVLLLE